jgi:hypothetical protein
MQRPARRLAPFNACTVIFSLATAATAICAAASASGGALLQLGKLKLELLEHCASFRGLPKPLVAQLGKRILELLDHRRAVLRLVLGGRRLCLRRHQRIVLHNDQSVRDGKIARQRITLQCHAQSNHRDIR